MSKQNIVDFSVDWGRRKSGRTENWNLRDASKNLFIVASLVLNCNKKSGTNHFFFVDG